MADNRPRISFALTRQERAAFRVACARLGVPMSDVLRSAAGALVKAEQRDREFFKLHPDLDATQEGPLIVEFEVADAARQAESD